MKESENCDADFVAQLTDIQIPLTLYVRSLLPGDSAAMDVAQQANSIVWKKRAEFTAGTNFKAWVFSIARYEVLTYRKQQAKDARLVFSEELQEVVGTDLQTESLDFADRSDALRSCLAQLRSQDRTLIMHRYGSKRTLREFAQETGRSVGGLKVALHRLRNSLIQCIERKLSAAGQSQ